MKKDFIFAPILLVVGILLCLLKATGMTVHIIVSVVGLVALVLYTVATDTDKRPNTKSVASITYHLRFSCALFVVSI